MKTRKSTKNISHGFSLAEIAIGIIIIGLLVGAVVGSTVLIGQARIRSAITEMMQIQSRLTTFESAYGYKPGDFPEASLFWGTDACKPAGTTASKGANGDGDGFIKFATVTAGANNDDLNESYLVWCHMGKANLGPSTTPLKDIASVPTLGTHIIPAKFRGAGYIVASNATEFGFNAYQHALLIGSPVATMLHPNGIITPLDAYSVDKKLDDGLPGTGLIRATAGDDKTTAGACVDSDQYNLHSRGKQAECTMAMRVD